MSNPTPTPQNPVPSEPGWYWATYHRYGRTDRIVANVLRDDDGNLVVYARMDNFEICGMPLDVLTDWSPRITEPKPHAASVAGNVGILRIALDEDNAPAFYLKARKRLPALLDELEQLRGIIADPEKLEWELAKARLERRRAAEKEER